MLSLGETLGLIPSTSFSPKENQTQVYRKQAKWIYKGFAFSNEKVIANTWK
jgi:hypothetical protein